jgi:hypothetical protein
MPKGKELLLKGLGLDLEALEEEADAEIKQEKRSKMTEEQKILDDISREILRLERDLTLPDNPKSQASRVERLSEFIEQKDF